MLGRDVVDAAQRASQAVECTRSAVTSGRASPLPAHPTDRATPGPVPPLSPTASVEGKGPECPCPGSGPVPNPMSAPAGQGGRHADDGSLGNLNRASGD